MATENVFLLNKNTLPKLFAALVKDHDLLIPVRMEDNQESTQYVPYEEGMSPDLERQPMFPIKELFFDKREVLLTWEGKKMHEPKLDAKPKAIFALRRCDLNAVLKQDIAFSADFDDPYYQKRRKNAFLIGYHCSEAPGDNCFCGSMQLKDFFDLMLYTQGDNFLVEVGSKEGEKFVKHHKDIFEESDQTITPKMHEIKGLKKLDYSGISGSKDNKAWDELVKKCLSCSACTALCPSCYCHEIKDLVNPLQVDSGERVRNWSSCQVQSFTRVAGDEIFRKERRERYLHRIFHHLLYFEEKNDEPLCVGCGRCISFCPTRIDFVETLNKISSKGGGA